MKRIGILLIVCMLLTLLPAPAMAAGPEVAGKSALLMDMETGTVLYAQNEHARLAPASVTKVMTMLLIMEAIDDGRIGWDDTVIASEAAAAKGGSQIYLNDCACAMAEHIAGSESAFVELMNKRAEELGMQDTHFVNCTGLDDEENAREHLTSAYDIALMSRELMKNHPDITKFTTIWMDTVRGGAFGLSNTNKLVRFYPGATGLKTGFTSGAGYCLSATAERDGMGLIAVVMGCETSKDRFAACKQLLDYGFANYALVAPEASENAVPVKLGTSDFVSAVPAESPKLLVDKAQKNQVQTLTELEETVSAPVSKGQKLGMMTIKVGEQTIRQIPMVAEEGVARLTWWEVFLQIFRKVAMSGE